MRRLVVEGPIPEIGTLSQEPFDDKANDDRSGGMEELAAVLGSANGVE
jgi:hypothetical protein